MQRCIYGFWQLVTYGFLQPCIEILDFLGAVLRTVTIWVRRGLRVGSARNSNRRNQLHKHVGPFTGPEAGISLLIQPL